MATYFTQGSPQTDLTRDDLRSALFETFKKLEPRRKVLALPPDFTRVNSMAGPLCSMAYEYFGDRLTDVMPALGTHVAMPDWQLDRMFSGVPTHLFRAPRLAQRRGYGRRRSRPSSWPKRPRESTGRRGRRSSTDWSGKAATT